MSGCDHVLVRCSSGHRNWMERSQLNMAQAYYCAVCGNAINAPLTDPSLTDAEKKAQGSRCACRGADDYCVCQNVPDGVTLDGRDRTEPVAEAKAEPVDLTELLEWRDHDSQSEITYTGFGPYMVERLAEDRFRAWFPDEAQVARIMVEGFAGRSEARNACQNDLDGRRALRLVRECAPFLYPGETPLQRIERERKDVDRLLSALAAAKEAKATPVPPVAQQRDEVIEECAKAALGDQVNDRRAADPDHPDSDYAAGRVDAAAAIRALSPERKDQSNG